MIDRDAFRARLKSGAENCGCSLTAEECARLVMTLEGIEDYVNGRQVRFAQHMAEFNRRDQTDGIDLP